MTGYLCRRFEHQLTVLKKIKNFLKSLLLFFNNDLSPSAAILISNHDLERRSRDVDSIETSVEVMHSLLLGNKSDRMFVITQGRDEAIVFVATGTNNFAFHVSSSSIHAQQQVLWYIRGDGSVGDVGNPDALGVIISWLDVHLDNDDQRLLKPF